MATYKDTFGSGWAELQLVVTQSSQNIAANTSVVSISLKIKKLKACSSYNNGGANVYIKKTTGTDATLWSSKTIDIRSLAVGSTKTLKTVSKTYTHGNDGTLKLTFKGYCASGVGLGTASCSGTFTFTTIPRASTMSCPSSFTAGTAGGISISRKSSSFTHTASCSLAGALSATSGITTYFTYTPPLTLFSSYPTTTALSGTIYVQTKSGSTNIGGQLSSGFTVYFPDNAATKPACSMSAAFQEYGSSYLTRYGVLIAGKSRLQTTCSSSGKYNATIAGHFFTVPGSSATISGATMTTGYLTTASSQANFAYQVRDSRGFYSVQSVAANPYKVVNYTPPRINSFQAVRFNAEGLEDPNGEKVKFKVDYTVDPIRLDSAYASNQAKIKIYEITTDSTGTKRSNEITGITIVNGGFTGYAPKDYSKMNSYEFEATITDDLTTNEPEVGKGSLAGISTAICMMSFYEDRGMAIGKIAEGEGLDIAMQTYINGVDMTLDDETIQLWSEILGGGGSKT